MRTGFFGGTARRFSDDRRGHFAVLTGVVMSMLAVGVGMGVNLAQLYTVKSNLRHALDSAVTSTARDLTTGVIATRDVRRSVEAFLFANAETQSIAGRDLVLSGIDVDTTRRTVEATAHVDVDLFFPLFAGSGTQRVAAANSALYSDRLIEVAMMLDVTGSMARSGRIDKIGDLRAAASNAVELMLGSQNPSNPRVRVAIVPYAEAVNTGRLADTVFVETRGGADLPPAVDAPVAVAASRPDACATERRLRSGAADLGDDGPGAERRNGAGKIYLARVNRDDRLGVCPSAALVPLTADKEVLLDTIEDFRASGVTAGGIAAQWGYYMLSPKWRGAIRAADAGDGPANHDPNKVSKVAILMTDGQFNTAFAGVGAGETPQLQQGTRARANAEAICAAMKADGIRVFTIGFDLDNPGMSRSERDQAKSVLRNCASTDTPSSRHYFEASTGAELDKAFREIIANTERLALTR